jgi:peptidoglycan hydrolase CwlO-like protein
MSEINHSPCREEVLRAEIERLLADLKHLRKATISDRQEITRLQAEIERLRTGLKEILDMWHRGHTVRIGEVARRVLEGK